MATSRSSGRAAALSELEQITSDPRQCQMLLAAAGLTGRLLAVFRTICDYCSDGDNIESIIAAAGLAGGIAEDVEVLRMTGALRAAGEDELRPEPLLASAAATAHLPV